LLRKLFCARDHFGVKPFFYARAESCLVFSNTLDCLRKHPAISGALDDLWIADFLLFERSLEPGATAYADIRRLPPAHTLSFTDSKLKIACYWSLPVDLCIRYRPQGDYVEHFKILLDQAVADRLRTDRVGVVMSGGMDSTAVAAVAQEVLRRSGQPFELDAHTVVYDRLIPDEERRYASAAASRLGIPIHYLPADDYPLFGQDVAPCIAHCPEPSNSPERAMYAEFVAQFARHSRVVLTGWDGDALLNESPLTYLRWLRAQRQFRRLLAECASLIFKRPGQVFHGIWKRLRAGKRPEQKEPEYPAWINPSLERRFAMKERWARFHGHVEPGHPLRPFAYHSYTHIQRLSNFFDGFDPGVTGQPVEYRHPLLDLRLVEYCLSLPPLPWCVRKEILRAAMKRHLPRSILKRPKTPLAGFPHLALLRQPAASWLDGFAPAPSLEKYVVRSRIPAIRTSDDPAWTWWNLRPLSLNLWLAETEPSRTRGQSE
jgi:asparagine synthase (glutamine-hydrolysing)